MTAALTVPLPIVRPASAVSPETAQAQADALHAIRTASASMRKAGGIWKPMACLLDAEAQRITERGLVYGESFAAWEIADAYRALL